jgi:hypothetical protein
MLVSVPRSVKVSPLAIAAREHPIRARIDDDGGEIEVFGAEPAQRSGARTRGQLQSGIDGETLVTLPTNTAPGSMISRLMPAPKVALPNWTA